MAGWAFSQPKLGCFIPVLADPAKIGCEIWNWLAARLPRYPTFSNPGNHSYPSIRRACFLIYQIILAFLWIKAQNKIQNRNFRRDFWERGFYERPLWYIAYSPWIWTKWSKTAQWTISTHTDYSQAWFLRKVPLEISERTFRSTCILFRGGVSRILFGILQ